MQGFARGRLPLEEQARRVRNTVRLVGLLKQNAPSGSPAGRFVFETASSGYLNHTLGFLRTRKKRGKCLWAALEIDPHVAVFRPSTDQLISRSRLESCTMETEIQE